MTGQTVVGETQSLCPHCLRVISATRIAEGENVYLEKHCPDHGRFRTLIWRDKHDYREWGKHLLRQGGLHQRSEINSNLGCPRDCGLCAAHEQDTCSAVIEVIQHCDLNCPVCFAASQPEAKGTPSIESLGKVFGKLFATAGHVPVQLSGGEPTLRDDLPEVIALARNTGFPHIQLNTNGIRIARDKQYLARLKDAGLSVVFLQCDGIDDHVYRHIRGANLFDLKWRALEHCAELHVGVILVPTLVPGVNTDQIGAMVQFAKDWMPTVKGIHFQPISYFGRYPRVPTDNDRLTIPEVLEYLELQTKGEVCREALGASEPRYCSFSGLFVLDDQHRLVAVSGSARREMDGRGPSETAAERTREYVSGKWRYFEREKTECCACGSCAPSLLFDRAREYSLSVSGMAFQDVWNLDLERLKRCCIHVATPAGGLIPLCAYYLSDLSGSRIYSQIGRHSEDNGNQSHS